jgi:hypothetical protein
MKNTVLKFGLISGATLVAMMLATIPFMDKIGFDYGMYIGYTTMLVAFLLIFFGIRSYRDNVGDGWISFPRALGVGFLIMLISCICYVVAWEITYFNFLPDFFEKYSAHVAEKMRASGKSAAELATELEKMESMKVIYNNPVWNSLITFMEPLPMGLPITLISAIIVTVGRKKTRGEEVAVN